MAKIVYIPFSNRIVDVSAWLRPVVVGWVPFKHKSKTIATIVPSECLPDSSTQMNNSNMNKEFI